MGTSAILIALISTLYLKPAISAAIDYEPIKITVNENFNAPPGQVSKGFQYLEPGVGMHQGANFYFKPKFTLPSSSIPHHIEALMSLIQHHHSCAKDGTNVVFEKDKLMEFLKKFLYSTETLSDIDLEEKNNSEIGKPLPILITEELKPPSSEILVSPEAPPLSYNEIPNFVENEVKKEEMAILENIKRVSEEPIVIDIEPKPVTPEFIVIPEAPVLPLLSSNDVKTYIKEEMKNKKESIILEESTGETEGRTIVEVKLKPATPELEVIPETPVLPPLSANEIRIIEEKRIDEPITLQMPESIVVSIEPKPAAPELFVIPEAPVLPPLSFSDIKAYVEEKIKKKQESIILEKSIGEAQGQTIIEIEPKPITSEVLVISEAPVLSQLAFQEVAKEESTVLEEIKSVSEEPIVIEIEPKPATPELLVFPEAPVLPPLSFNDIKIYVEEEMKNKKESIILEESTGQALEPTIIEVEPKPATTELEVIPKAPVLPPLSGNDIRIIEEVRIDEPVTMPMPEPIVVDIEPKPVAPELLVIPEAPVLPPLSFNDIKAYVEEEMKEKEESIILEKSFQEEAKKESVILEEIKSVSEEPIVIEIKPKPSTPELLVFPEAPVLPPRSFDDIKIYEYIEEQMKNKKESIRLEESVGEALEPTIIEVEPKPATPELEIIPEAPVLPPLSGNDIRIIEEVRIGESVTMPMPESIVVGIEPKPVAPELLVIPEAPVLPPLSFNDIKIYVEEEMKNKKESIILEESTGQALEPTIIEVEPIPASPELEVIPEAPVLPQLSGNDIRIIEEVRVDEPITLPMPESIAVGIEPKPVAPELLVIPEAPVLPPLSFNDIKAYVEEEIKNKKQSIILEESTGEAEELSIIEVEPKPATPELEVIPEAPVLPPLSFNDIKAYVEEEIKNKKESIILEESTGEAEEQTVIEIEPKPATAEVLVMPEAPVLSPLAFENIPPFVNEEVKKEDAIVLEEIKRVSEEPIVIEIKPKPATPELVLIPEAPELPPLSANDIRIVEEAKLNESTSLPMPESIVVDIKPKPLIPLHLINPNLPMLPPLTFKDIRTFVEEEMKKKGSLVLEEATDTLRERTMFEIEPKSTIPELVFIPEAPVLPPLSKNDIRIVEKARIDEPISLPMPEPIVVDIAPKPATPEFLVIPEAPVLPPLSFNGIPPNIEEVNKEESIILNEATGVSQEPTITEVEPEPELVVITELPVLPSQSFNSRASVFKGVEKEETVILEESKEALEEPIIMEIEPNSVTLEETETAESFALKNNIFPIATEEVKIEIPILLEESIEVFPPKAEISSRPSLQEPEISNSYVLEEVSERNSEHFKESLPPTIIRKPSNNLGLFSYAPFLSHLSNRAPKRKQIMFPKPVSLERFLLKKHPLRLPVTPFPKLSIHDIKSPFLRNKNQFLYPTSYAHDVVEKRIAPNMGFKNNAPPKRVKIYIRSHVPK